MEKRLEEKKKGGKCPGKRLIKYMALKEREEVEHVK